MEHTIKGIDKDDNIITNKVFTSKKITVGKIPIMTQSSFCILHDIPQVSFNTIGECKYDELFYY